ncbi:MAG TPA: SxtJ family membrane protein [Nitrospiria bacterium]|jgi:hypothetical protein|nr:SxtJ family membrane protein [Nitrospiria bacterium]
MKIKLDRKVVRNFGLILALLLALLGCVKIYKGQMAVSFLALFFSFLAAVSALFFQPVIRPIYIGAMKISIILGWINTRVLLILIYFLLLSPLCVVLRIFGRNSLDEKIEPHKESYWIRREKVPFDKKSYERQF